MNKVGNFFISIGKGIKKGFLGLINWIKNTAWIQPLLIVGLIFGAILCIKPVINWVGDIFNPDETYAFYNENKYTIDGIEDKVKDDERAIVIFYSDDDSVCGSIEKELKSFASNNKPSAGAENQNAATWYCIDITLDDEDEQEAFDEYFLNNLHDKYELKYKENISEYESMKISSYDADSSLFGDDSLSIPTPLFARYEKGELKGIRPGILTNKVEEDLQNFVYADLSDWADFKNA